MVVVGGVGPEEEEKAVTTFVIIPNSESVVCAGVLTNVVVFDDFS